MGKSTALPANDENLLRQKKRTKYVVFAAAFAVFQVVQILVLFLVIMKVKTPDVRLRSATLLNLDITNSSFNGTLKAEFGVKNPNFGPFKYQNSSVQLFYMDSYLVGEAGVVKEKVRFRSTKKVDVLVNFSSIRVAAGQNPRLRSELSSGSVTLTVRSKLEGKVTLMMFLKKKRTGDVDCILTIDLHKKSVREFKCD
ncbi:unnamed protein product [Cuscuta epithymum]|uniref:Late embryogenesis abundant protein LEA-2 subgroup domain-containing protein n=1 Tax=Cuscuta epithymum TaxID=186058 RepID=A0AAV0FN53_9ASTE|nr:unnamed protein product [Cuscuta epithymum]CAH9137013.1 unnamed protein product [Cuscuta epithymum]